MKIIKVFKLGRMSNDGEFGKGKIIHAMPADRYTPGVKISALCGSAPGRTSLGWRDTERQVTCPKCWAYIARRQKARNVVAIARLNIQSDIDRVSPAGLTHAMRAEKYSPGIRSQALCGAKPGPGSAGWYAFENSEVKCPHCRKRMERNGK